MRPFIVAFAAAAVAAAPPLEYYYDRPDDGCNLTPVAPQAADPTGLVAAPYVTYVKCANTSFYGYNDESFRVYRFLADGGFDSLWVEAGAFFNITLDEGYFTGGRFAPHLAESSPYPASVIRHYTVGNAVVAHDEHVNEGESATTDLLWTNVDLYQPPLVMVVSCGTETLWVKDHYHPKGALYVALVGTQCFLVDGANRCIEAQTDTPAVRWVSPLLRYNESFRASSTRSPFVDDTLGYSCDSPIAFAVEKFDYLRNDTLPEFVEIPSASMAITNDLRETMLVV